MLKRILTTLFAAAVMSVVCVAAELNGKGIKSDPYVIGTADDFCEFARLVNSGEAGRAFAVLTNDIDFENTEYTVVGNRNNPFCGNFNANGFAVKNVTLSTISEEYINSDGEADIGLFGAVKGAEISGLTAQNINISIMPEDDVGNSLSVLNVGILAGYCMYDDRHTDAVVSDCEVSGSITVGNGKVRCRIGGVVGTVYSRTVGSSFFLNRVASHVKTESYTKSFCFAGGVVGNVDISAVMASCGIREVYSGGSVVSSSECSLPLLGGIIGYALCESEWAGLSEETDKKSTDKETNVKDCFSDCSIENQKKNGYSGSTCGYSLSLKSENVFCSSDKYYCTKS